MNKIFNEKDLEKYADKKGFIHINALPAYDKIVSKICELPNYVPTKESKPDYPWRIPAAPSEIYISFVEEYVNRIFKNYSGRWIQLSTYKSNESYWDLNDNDDKYIDNRKTILMYVSKISYAQSMNNRFIVIYYVDVNGNFNSINIKTYDLSGLAFRFCTDDEISIINKLVGNSRPEPYIERFLIKDEYKENYDLYLKDAKKYGYNKKILNKNLIFSCKKNTSFDKNGYIYCGKSVDVRFINVE